MALFGKDQPDMQFSLHSPSWSPCANFMQHADRDVGDVLCVRLLNPKADLKLEEPR